MVAHQQERLAMKFLRTPEHKRLMELLAAARKSVGLTQQELADQIGENQNFISKYECGERRLDMLEIAAISRPIGFDMADAVRDIEAQYGPIVNPKLRQPGKAKKKKK
jgi:transcriptional regulator with XRE-family HTH domain